MGNLAQIAKKKGFEVFGVDQKFYPPMSDELLNAGIKFEEGYEERNFVDADIYVIGNSISCLLYTSPSPRDPSISRMPSSA